MRILSLITHFSHVEDWEANTTRIDRIDPLWAERSLLSKARKLVQLASDYDCIVFFYDTHLPILFRLLYALRYVSGAKVRLIFTTFLCDVSRFSQYSPLKRHWIYDRLRWIYYSIFVRLIDVIVVHSSTEVDLYAKAFRVPPDRCRFVPYYVGPVHYTVLGDGADRAWLESQVQRLGLGPSVTFVGAVSDVRPYLTHADLFLLPSYSEGLPNAYLEAMAMGLPTVVSTDPPYDEIARSEFSVRVDRDNPEAMVQAIVQLLGNPVCRVAMGQAARCEAEKEYAWPKIGQEYLNLFVDLTQIRSRKHLHN